MLIRILTPEEAARRRIEARKEMEEIARNAGVFVPRENLDRWYGEKEKED